MALPASATELYHSSERVSSRKQGALAEVVGKKLYDIAPADLATGEAAAWDETWSIAGATIYPDKVVGRPGKGGTPGTDSMAITFRGWDLSNFPVGGATVSTLSAKTLLKGVERRTGEYDGSTKALNTFPDSNGFTYLITDGAFLDYTPETVIEINTGIRRADFSLDILDGAGLLNAGVFMGRDPQTLLIAGVNIPRAFLVDADSEVIPVTYVLWYRSSKWPIDIKVEQYKDYVVFEPLAAFDSGGEIEGYYAEDHTVVGTDASAATVAWRGVTRRRASNAFTTSNVVSLDSETFTFLAGLLWWQS